MKFKVGDKVFYNGVMGEIGTSHFDCHLVYLENDTSGWFGESQLSIFATPEADKTLKPTNPKDALGSDKLPLHLWPASATAFGCIGLANGMTKYGRHNWREAGIRPSIYIDACVRHLTDWFEGNESDPEDGVHNLSAAIACIAILIDASVTDKLNDDRNYNGGGWRRARDLMEPHVKRLKELRKDKTPKHYTIADNKDKP